MNRTEIQARIQEINTEYERLYRPLQLAQNRHTTFIAQHNIKTGTKRYNESRDKLLAVEKTFFKLSKPLLEERLRLMNELRALVAK